MKAKSVFSFWISMLAWVAVVVQLYILVNNYLHEGKHVLSAVVKFFSYFTILTNMLVALAASLIYLKGKKSEEFFFSKISVLGAIAANIAVVAFIYNLILRDLWDPQGVQYYADELLHVFVPALYVLFWLFFVKKGELKWVFGLTWLVYPVVYTIYVFILGYFTKEYPYPFIDLNHLGIKTVLSNSGILFLVFLFSNFLFISLDKTIAYFKSKKSPSV